MDKKNKVWGVSVFLMDSNLDTTSPKVYETSTIESMWMKL